MGIMSKIKPKSNKVFSKTGPAPTSGDLFASTGGEDEPTLFTCLMILYYGMYALTLLFYPSVHAADGPMGTTNPMWFWKTITPEIGFCLRMLGAAMTTILLGPFLDEIFGGSGVTMKAFTQQLLIVNTLVFFIFLWFGIYSPIPGCNPFAWQVTAGLGGLILGWNLVEATGLAVTRYYAIFCTLYFGSFAFGTMSFPSVLFGPPSPVAYWKTWTDLSFMMVRAFGATMFCAFILGYLYYGNSQLPSYCRMLTLFNFIFLFMFIQPAFFSPLLSSAVVPMWEIQLCMQIPILSCGLFLELCGVSGPLVTNFSLPKCGMNAETFNFFNLLFFLPFIGITLSPYTNLIMGPGNPIGMGFFTVDLDEAALWHGKAWAITTLMLILGPYVFGFPAVKVAKQNMVHYGAFLAIVSFCIFYKGYTIFNPLTFYPLVGLNALVFFWGVFLATPKQAGESMV